MTRSRGKSFALSHADHTDGGQSNKNPDSVVVKRFANNVQEVCNISEDPCGFLAKAFFRDNPYRSEKHQHCGPKFIEGTFKPICKLNYALKSIYNASDLLIPVRMFIFSSNEVTVTNKASKYRLEGFKVKKRWRNETALAHSTLVLNMGSLGGKEHYEPSTLFARLMKLRTYPAR